jgi:hypothetical protein
MLRPAKLIFALSVLLASSAAYPADECAPDDMCSQDDFKAVGLAYLVAMKSACAQIDPKAAEALDKNMTANRNEEDREELLRIMNLPRFSIKLKLAEAEAKQMRSSALRSECKSLRSLADK